MHNVSELYRTLLQGEYGTECRLLAGPKNAPVDQLSIVYGEDELVSIKTSHSLFSDNIPKLGCCVSAKISVTMLHPKTQPPRQGKLVPQVRITDGTQHSEWLTKGIFYVDTRNGAGDLPGAKTLTLIGYDAMLMAEQDYPASKLDWPASPYDVVKEIADFLGWELEYATVQILQGSYEGGVQYPGEYSCRETLGYIAAMFGGVFMMNHAGELELVLLKKLMHLNRVGRVLGSSPTKAILFGGRYIRV